MVTSSDYFVACPSSQVNPTAQFFNFFPTLYAMMISILTTTLFIICCVCLILRFCAGRRLKCVNAYIHICGNNGSDNGMRSNISTAKEQIKTKQQEEEEDEDEEMQR